MIENLFKKLDKKLNIAVIGDIMLDVYRVGKVERISPEFPVPILKEEYDTPIMRPGGSSNVAAQFLHFNCNVSLFGFADQECIDSISGFGFNTDGVINLINGRVPRKVRLYSGDHPILRMDRENDNCGVDDLSSERTRVGKKLIDRICDFDVIVLSNYCKGLFDEDLAQSIIQKAKSCNVPTIVDPKRYPSWWRGCSIFKPNYVEALMMVPEAKADKLKEIVGCDSVIVTNGANGIYGICLEGNFEYKPRIPVKDVRSTSGAGDSYAAILAYCIGSNMPIKDACKIAFEGGSEYVRNLHNRPISFYEIKRRILPNEAKIVSIEELVYLKNNVFKNDKWIMTNGCFDAGLTPNHIKLLRHAKSLGDKLIVAVNSDESVRKLKDKNRPICNLIDRMMILSGLEDVDFVVSFDENTPLELIKKVMPNILVKGGDYIPENVAGYGIVDINICEKFNYMTTSEKIKKLNVQNAESYDFEK